MLENRRGIQCYSKVITTYKKSVNNHTKRSMFSLFFMHLGKVYFGMVNLGIYFLHRISIVVR